MINKNELKKMVNNYELLKYYRSLKLKIRYDYSKLDELEKRSLIPTINFNATFKSSNINTSSPSDILFYKKENIINEIDENLKIIQVINKIIKEVLKEIENNKYKILLIERYLHNRTFKEISTILRVGEKYIINKTHPRALKEFYRILKKALDSEPIDKLLC